MARDFTAANTEYFESSTLPVSAAPFTWSIWVNPDDVTTEYTVMGIGDSVTAANYWELTFDGDAAGDPVRFTARDDSGTATAGTSSGYSAGVWSHAAAVETSSSSRAVFLNGGGKGTNSDSRSPSSDIFRVGARADTIVAQPLNGSIGEVAIWDVALSDAEILNLSRRVSPLRVRPGSLVGYWPLMGTSDTSNEADFSGNVNTLTQNNTIPSADHPPVSPQFCYGVWRQQTIPFFVGKPSTSVPFGDPRNIILT